jgi:glycosyltransferase involved in cell wall biosynthesis
MTRPTVSVIIPTYNRADTLSRAIDSVIAQTFLDWELVVVDDGSVDGTPHILEEYHARLVSRFISVRQGNRGCSAARNRGIELCRGRFVAFLDSDDEFLPHKLSRQVELFSACPELSFVYGDYAFVDLEGQRTDSALNTKFPLARRVSTRIVAAGLHATGSELFETLLHGYFIATIVGLVRREALGEIRFDERLSYAEEWLFYLRLARAGRAGFVDEPLALHHFTRNSLTRTDKCRNMVRQCELFHAMKKQFPDLALHETAIVNGHLANAHSQLANHLRSTGNPARALVSAARAYYYRCQQGQNLVPAQVLSPSRHATSQDSDELVGDQVHCLPAR